MSARPTANDTGAAVSYLSFIDGTTGIFAAEFTAADLELLDTVAP